MKLLAITLLTALLFTACSEDNDDPGPSAKGHYNMYVTGDKSFTYESGEVTLWNPGSNGDIIVLGPEKVGQGIDVSQPDASTILEGL